MMDSPPLLEARRISKSFPGVQALQEVALTLYQGEVLAVVGENGAGKSTLMKILGGVYQPDSGDILCEGRPIAISSVDESLAHGIVLIHQELNLAENLDVGGNLFLGREPTMGGPFRLIQRKIYADSQILLDRIGLGCSPKTIVAQLSPGQKQLVEIARALSLKSRIIIMDEPTSSLTQRETERLFEVIRELKQNGISTLYISHRLKEVEEIADRVIVLRDGQNAGELAKAEISHEAIVPLMVGRELTQFFQRSHTVESFDTGCEIRDFRVTSEQVHPIRFVIPRGQIVGLAGLMGAGRTELAEAIFGVRPRVGGSVVIDGQPIEINNPPQAIEAGIYLIPEDRRLHGLVLPASVRHNISLASLARLNRARILDLHGERELADEMCRKLKVRTPSLGQTVGLLSGGNQQKVVLAKWLSKTPKLLILDEPTRGIDVGAKAEIYSLMDRLAAQGVAILMISSDLEEILNMSDRVLVMREGELAGELARDELDEEAVMRLAVGGSS